MMTFIALAGLALASSLLFLEVARRARATRSVAQIRADLEAGSRD
jgi:hypothetical protein